MGESKEESIVGKECRANGLVSIIIDGHMAMHAFSISGDDHMAMHAFSISGDGRMATLHRRPYGNACF